MLQFADIRAAAGRLAGVAHRTPVLTPRTLDELLGAQVFMKAGNLQRMSAFQFRGGYGAVPIPPYDYLPAMASQGTAALELIEDAGPLDALIVCAGGGGFLSGCTVAARHLLPDIRIYGSEPERGNDMRRSLRSGAIVGIEVPRTICDGQQTRAVGARPFEVIRRLVADAREVPDPVVLDVMRFVALMTGAERVE